MPAPLRVNLARRPFVNRRPLVRLTTALWVLGALLLVTNGLLIWRHRAGTAEGRVELARVRAAATREIERARALEGELAALGLAEQNEHVEFLNQRIAQRAFPWSRLFEQLAEVMPPGVRLRGLFPAVGEQQEGRRSRRRRTVLETDVRLSIRAQAESDEDMLELVDRLFAHPAFDRPNLFRENQEGGVVGFSLDVLYRPDLEPPAPGDAGAVQTSTAPPPAGAGEGVVDGEVAAGGGVVTAGGGGAAR
jgi:Tfp pilus assembly protein PilN